MIPVIKKDTTLDLYSKFSNQPYVPHAYWSTEREFALNPLYQQIVPVYQENFQLQTPTHEFVLDTSLVPPPGIEPGSSDFQSGA